MRLLVDMNLSPRWVAVLTDAGFEALHWSSVGPHNAPDTMIMDYARQNNFTVITHDLDFGAILAAAHGDQPSVIQLRADNVSPEVAGQYVLSALRQMAPELEAGVLLTIDAARVRMRLLPLRP